MGPNEETMLDFIGPAGLGHNALRLRTGTIVQDKGRWAPKVIWGPGLLLLPQASDVLAWGA